MICATAHKLSDCTAGVQEMLTSPADGVELLTRYTYDSDGVQLHAVQLGTSWSDPEDWIAPEALDVMRAEIERYEVEAESWDAERYVGLKGAMW